MKIAPLFNCLLFALACVVPAGCGSPQSKDRPAVNVSGSVTLDGKPMPDGDIFFVSDSEGVREMLSVKDGKFSGKASIGSRKIEVRGYREAKPTKEASEMYGADAQPSKENFLPAKFNTETTLTADVKSGGAPLEFAVTSQ